MKTRTFHIPYGKGHIRAKIHERYISSIVEPKRMQPIQDTESELDRALKEPINSPGLQEKAYGCKDPCILVSDSTRPTPSGLIASSALKILNGAGISDERIKIIVATGLHRPCTEAELTERLGNDILNRVEVFNHDAFDESNLVYAGETSRGTPVMLNRVAYESDLLIGDGYIEPHFFAGFTGGGKNILPGISGLETVKANHGAKMIDHPRARTGILDGNPIYKDILEGAQLGGLDFSINVTLDVQKRVSAVFAGHFDEAHREGCRFLERFVKVEAAEADIVITTNGGYPLDRNLYQAVKGMTVAEEVVKEGGVAIIASECRDGVGHPRFRELVERCGSPEEILETIRSPGFFEIDQWEAQILARVLERCDVICVTGGVEDSTLKNMHLIPSKNVEEALSLAVDSLGRSPEITIIPGGPSTIPFVPTPQ